MTLQIINYENGVPKNGYKRVIIKSCYKKPLLGKVVTTETNKMVTTVSNGYLRIVEIVSNGHIRLTILAIIKSPSTLKVFLFKY
jgi:hypothetical protein